jgi:hypothetical protein
LRLHVLPYGGFIPANRGNMIASGPEMLSDEIPPVPLIIARYVYRALALDVSGNLSNRILKQVLI